MHDQAVYLDTRHRTLKWRLWDRAGSRPVFPGHEGTVTVEFALAAPILVTLLLGVCDLAPTMMMRFKVGAATQAVADLATQSAVAAPADLANNMAIGADVMAPFNGSNLVLRITNIASDGNGNAFVYWSCGLGALPPLAARNTITSNPAGIITLGAAGLNTSYVMVEAQYTYSAPAGFIFRAPQVVTAVAYTLPRVSTYIGPTLGGSNYVPPKPASTSNNYSATINGVTCNAAV